MNGFEYELNVPLGTSGGDTANGMFCDQAGALGFPFVPIERNVVHTNLISSGDNGSFWVYVGAYLNGGGRTDLYYQQITATLTPLTLAPIQPLARYITVYPTPNAGMPSAIRVKLVSLHHPNPPYFGPPGPSFAAFEGQYRWLGAPFDCQDSVTLGTEFKCAVLQCTPMYVDWEAVLGPYVLYVTGSEIVPSSTFLVQMIDEGQDVQNEANYTTSVQVKTARWGDVAEAFQQPSPAPLSQPDVFDVVAAVDRLKDLSNAMIKPRGQLQPAAVDPANAFTVVEVAMAVDALKGKPYPFTQMQTCP
jgi:hypothetical protein